jgi:sarcosine oxidase subunit alpha
MSTTVQLQVNGVVVDVPEGANVAAAVARVPVHFRRSSNGEPRAPLCGMGVCFECRVTVDDEAHVLACLTPARAGMRVRTDD